MKKKDSDKQYTVTAKIVIISEVEITASTFEEALENAKLLSEKDFVTIKNNDCNGCSIQLISISKPSAWDID